MYGYELLSIADSFQRLRDVCAYCGRVYVGT